MYMSTAGLTGSIVVIMLLFRPEHIIIGRVGVFLTALSVIVGSLPIRKGIALALEYLVDGKVGDEQESPPPPERVE